MNRQAVRTALTQLTIMSIGFVSSVITAHWLGVEGRGVYFVAVTFGAVVMQLSGLGLQSSNTYYASQDESLLPVLLANSVWASLIGGLLGGAVAFLVLFGSGAVHQTDVPYLALALCYVPAAQFFILGTNLLVAMQRSDLYNRCLLAYTMWNLFCNVAAAMLWPSIGGFLVASVVGNWLPALLLLASLASRLGSDLRLNWDIVRASSRYAGKAYFASLLAHFILRSAVFVLNRFDSAEQLGCFSVASQLGDVLMVLPMSVGLLLFPSLLREQADRWPLVVKTMRQVAVVVALACVAAALLAGPFIQVSFGASFLPARSILLAMLPGVFCISLATVVSQYLSASGFPRAQVGSWALALLVMLAGCVALVPRYHAVGAAMALSISYFVLLVLLFALAWRWKRLELPAASPVAVSLA